MTYTKELLKLFPTTRIKPVDGMAVTADVWEEAHDYHRDLLRYHALFNHGTGIVTGLEVIARDPADSMVYVLPGIAVDSVGRTIIMSEPFAYDFNQGDETLYLLFTHQEGRPQNRNGREDAPLYVNAGYGLEAVSNRPSTPYVELARIDRSAIHAPIHNAEDATHPLTDQLDLRYREVIGAQNPAPLTIGLWDARDQAATMPSQVAQRGISILARSLRNQGRRSVWADLKVAPQDDLSRYTFIHLIVDDLANVVSTIHEKNETKVLYDYLLNGGTMVVESADDQLGVSDRHFLEVCEALGQLFHVDITAVDAEHPLLESPHFFAQLPNGVAPSEGDGSALQGLVSEGGGLILSTCGFSHRWAGQGRNGPLPREEIRSAIEWGENLLSFAAERRKNQWS